MDSGSLQYTPEPPIYPGPSVEPSWSGRLSRKNKIIAIIAAIFLLGLAYHQFVSAPTGAEGRENTDKVISISSGEGLSAAADQLQTVQAVRSEFVFKSLMVLFGGSHGLQAGDYYFAKPENAIHIAWRLTHHSYDLVQVRVTIPEGLNVNEIAAILEAQPNLTHFNNADFLKIATPYEGYLFPDTYYLMPNMTAQDIVDDMLANYKTRIKTLQPDIAAFGKPIGDVIKMASILEEEARTDESRETIAGILWKRLAQGIPLQVDSAFVFVDGKRASKDLTSSDLAIQSPFNTYIHKGLPPTPISNPGLDSIRDAVHPIATKYYYYLSDAQGNMHYAVTLEEHDTNKAEYLGN